MKTLTVRCVHYDEPPQPRFHDAHVGDQVMVDATRSFCSGGEETVRKVYKDGSFSTGGKRDRWDANGHALGHVPGYVYYVSHYTRRWNAQPIEPEPYSLPPRP